MNTAAMIKRVRPLLPHGESILAGCKVLPRGSAKQIALAIGGGVAGGVAGMLAGSKAGETPDTERGHGTSAFIAVTERYVLVVTLGALGRPKDVVATIERSQISSTSKGEAQLFGMKMMEIVLSLNSDDELGFGVAKVHRKYGDSVVAALN